MSIDRIDRRLTDAVQNALTPAKPGQKNPVLDFLRENEYPTDPAKVVTRLPPAKPPKP